MQKGAAMRGGGHCSTHGLVNEPAEGWQGVALRCLLAPGNKTHLATQHLMHRTMSGKTAYSIKGSAVC